MLIYFIVIALALQVFVSAETNETDASTLNLQCSGIREKKSLYDDYEHKLMIYIQKKDLESFSNLKDSFTLFATNINGSCARGKLEKIENPPFFIKLIEYAVKDDNYAKFTNSGGNSCVASVKEYLKKCVSNNTGLVEKEAPAVTVNATAPAAAAGNASGTHSEGTDVKMLQTTFLKLLKMSYLHFNESNCDITEDIRECVKVVMKNETTCKPQHSKFIDSLFNYTMTMCPSSPVEENPNPNTNDGANSFLFNPIVILLSLVGTMLVI